MDTPRRPHLPRQSSFMSLFKTSLTPAQPGVKSDDPHPSSSLTPEDISSPQGPVTVLGRSEEASGCPLCGVHGDTSKGSKSVATQTWDEDEHAYRRRSKPAMSRQKVNELNHLAMTMTPLTSLENQEGTPTPTLTPRPPTPTTEPDDRSSSTTSTSEVQLSPAMELPRVPSLTLTDMSASSISIASLASQLSRSLSVASMSSKSISGNGEGLEGAIEEPPCLVHYDSKGNVQGVWQLAYGQEGRVASAQNGTNPVSAHQIMRSNESNGGGVKKGKSSDTQTMTNERHKNPVSSQIQRKTCKSSSSVSSSTSTSALREITQIVNRIETLNEHAKALKVHLEERRMEDTTLWTRSLRIEWENENRRIRLERKECLDEVDNWMAVAKLLQEDDEAV
ncbi:hypothetical protein BD324DRAFT_223362 [Kockovaella imperatae]|uniref:Uncharacterized protein n=1 Tax=Kockovaella imperatae TaxID=4999 RepID=A0A1Y1UQ46_9TREE|nr:hypothetical protein BD324DRAFT_223362 [Kockovaella imperatae]ORX39624.1 hypothetical protein BD324DRAFT_223362 [Kockovaella imperatae]